MQRDSMHAHFSPCFPSIRSSLSTPECGTTVSRLLEIRRISCLYLKCHCRTVDRR